MEQQYKWTNTEGGFFNTHICPYPLLPSRMYVLYLSFLYNKDRLSGLPYKEYMESTIS